MDFWIPMATSIIVEAIRSLPPQNRYRKTFMKIFEVIWSKYHADVEFAAVVKKVEGGK